MLGPAAPLGAAIAVAGRFTIESGIATHGSPPLTREKVTVVVVAPTADVGSCCNPESKLYDSTGGVRPRPGRINRVGLSVIWLDLCIRTSPGGRCNAGGGAMQGEV